MAIHNQYVPALKPTMHLYTSKFSKVHVLRLRRGEWFKESLARVCQDNSIQAGALLSAVGSLRQVRLRLAGSDRFYESSEPHEIVSATGTLSQSGLHIHVSVSRSDGSVVGGHLVDGCEVYTTIELFLGELDCLLFTREPDEETGYRELHVEKA